MDTVIEKVIQWSDPTELPSHPLLRGLDWETLRDILSTPSVAQKTIIRMACLLADEAQTQTTVQKIALTLKTTEVTVLEAISHMPTLFRLFHGGHRVGLKIPGNDPAILSPRQKRELEKTTSRTRKNEIKRISLEAKDSENTPANEIMKLLKELNIETDQARSFSRWLVATYSAQAALDATKIALDAKPFQPQPYIISILRNASSAGIAARPKSVQQRTSPTGDRTTRFVGWSNQFPRTKLYRLPNGHLKSEPPATGEIVPTLEEDPGYVVKA